MKIRFERRTRAGAVGVALAVLSLACTDVAPVNGYDEASPNRETAEFIVDVALESHRRDVEEAGPELYDRVRVEFQGEDVTGPDNRYRAVPQDLFNRWVFPLLPPNLGVTGYQLRVSFDEDMRSADSCAGATAFEPFCTDENTTFDSGDRNSAVPIAEVTLERRRFTVRGEIPAEDTDEPATLQFFTDCDACSWDKTRELKPRRWFPLGTTLQVHPGVEFEIEDIPRTLPGTSGQCLVVRRDGFRPYCEQLDPTREQVARRTPLGAAGGVLTVAGFDVGDAPADGAQADEDVLPLTRSRLVVLALDLEGRDDLIYRRDENLVVVHEPDVGPDSVPIRLSVASGRRFLGDITPESCPLPPRLAAEFEKGSFDLEPGEFHYCLRSPEDGIKSVEVIITEPFGSRLKLPARIEFIEERALDFRLDPPEVEVDGELLPNRRSDGSLWFDESGEPVELVLDLRGSVRPSAVQSLEVVFCDSEPVPDDQGSGGPAPADPDAGVGAEIYPARCPEDMGRLRALIAQGVCEARPALLGPPDDATGERTVQLAPPPTEVGDGVRTQLACAYLSTANDTAVQAITIRRISSRFTFGVVAPGPSGLWDETCRLTEALRIDRGCPTAGTDIIVGERPWVRLCGSVGASSRGPSLVCDYPFLYKRRIRVYRVGDEAQVSDEPVLDTGWQDYRERPVGELPGTVQPGAGSQLIDLPFELAEGEERSAARRRVVVDVVDRAGRFDTRRETFRFAEEIPPLDGVEIISEANMGCHEAESDLENICAPGDILEHCLGEVPGVVGAGERCCQCLDDRVCAQAFSGPMQVGPRTIVRPGQSLPIRAYGLLDEASGGADSPRICLASGPLDPDRANVPSPPVEWDPGYTDAAPVCRRAELELLVPGAPVAADPCRGEVEAVEPLPLLLRAWGRGCVPGSDAALLDLRVDGQPPVFDGPCDSPPPPPDPDGAAQVPPVPAGPEVMRFPLRLRFRDPGTAELNGALRMRLVFTAQPLPGGVREALILPATEEAYFELPRTNLNAPTCACEPPVVTRRVDGLLAEGAYQRVPRAAVRLPDPIGDYGQGCMIDAIERIEPPPEPVDVEPDAGLDAGGLDAELDAAPVDGGVDGGDAGVDPPPPEWGAQSLCYRVGFHGAEATAFISRETFKATGQDGGYLVAVLEDAVGNRVAYQLYHDRVLVNPEPEP